MLKSFTRALAEGGMLHLVIHLVDILTEPWSKAFQGPDRKPLGVDLDASQNAPHEITIVPAQPGTYPAICDHYCGMGHGSMKMTFIVE